MEGAESVRSVSTIELASWVPLALNFDGPGPTIDWGDLGTMRFDQPFFDETIARWVAENPTARVQRTGVDMLATLDQAPSLEPSGFIFHSSRCGSTLLGRILRQNRGCVVVSEPSIINTVLSANASVIDEDTKVWLLRLVIRALGRRRLGDERHYVVKLSSWNICRCALFARAFPHRPTVWLQRRPAAVLHSLVAKSPSWLSWRELPDVASAILGLSNEEIASLDTGTFYARALTAFVRAAYATVDTMVVLDYSDLPDAAWSCVAPLFEITGSAEDLARMQQEARYDAKEAIPRMFKRSDAEIPKSIERLAEGELDQLYAALKDRRGAARGLPRSGAARS
jgi:hypothetical protein